MTSRSHPEDRLLRDIGRLLAEVEEGELPRHGDDRGAPEAEPAPISNAALDRIVDQVLAVTGAEAQPAEPELQQAEPQNDSVALPGPEGLGSSRKAWFRWGMLGVAASVVFVLSRVGSHVERDQEPTAAPSAGLAESPWEPSLLAFGNERVGAESQALLARPSAVAPSAALAEPPLEGSPWAPARKERAEPAPSGGYELQLQITSFEDRAEADAYVARLRQRGHRAHVQASRVPNRGLWYRVRLGPFHSKDEALAYKAEFEREESLGALLVDPRAEPPLALEWPSSSASPRVRAPGKKKAQPPIAAEPRESNAAPKERLLLGL